MKRRPHLATAAGVCSSGRPNFFFKKNRIRLLLATDGKRVCVLCVYVCVCVLISSGYSYYTIIIYISI